MHRLILLYDNLSTYSTPSTHSTPSTPSTYSIHSTPSILFIIISTTHSTLPLTILIIIISTTHSTTTFTILSTFQPSPLPISISQHHQNQTHLFPSLSLLSTYIYTLNHASILNSTPIRIHFFPYTKNRLQQY